MEHNSFTLKRLRAVNRFGLIALALACLSTGCMSTAQWFSPNAGHSKAAGPPQHMEAFWGKGVEWIPDPTKNGQPDPVLSCRLYFFAGEDVGYTSKADGTLTVDLYDDSGRASGQPSKHLEEWVFNSEVLPKMLQKDARLGDGYTIGLPWPSYRPDIRQV